VLTTPALKNIDRVLPVDSQGGHDVANELVVDRETAVIRADFLLELGLGQQLGRHVVDAHFVERVAQALGRALGAVADARMVRDLHS
jgi:hypothetical protein